MEHIPFLSITIFFPLLGSLILLILRPTASVHAYQLGVSVAALTLLSAIMVWIRGTEAGFSQVEELMWIPSLGAAYRVGVDGINLPLVLLTTVLFVAALIFSGKIKAQASVYVALTLLLETACLGVFLSLDILLFYVFFEVVLVGMYFIIAGWGHENRRQAALTFFIYTLIGSLFLLLALLGLYLYSDTQTFDMRVLISNPTLTGPVAALVFWAFLIAFAIKTPLFPFHTWLPMAHTEAPAAGSVILAGVLLKLGTYGLLRFALQMTPEAFRQYADVVMVLAVVSVLFGALVALAQTDIKRMVAYTSVNHMGYLMLGIAAAALANAENSTRALDGAVLQMVSHGIVTGALFLLVGALQDRTQTREMSKMQGMLQRTPTLGWCFVIAAFASLGLPGLAHFPAEFQIFLGSFSVYPVAVGITILGLAITTGLYLRAIFSVFMGSPEADAPDVADLGLRELWAIAPLIALTILIGIAPEMLLAMIHRTMQALGL